jgi:hypothetical protein
VRRTAKRRDVVLRLRKRVGVIASAPVCVLAIALAGLGSGTAAAADRAYELVSPPDKGGGEVTGNATRTRSAADGNAVMFSSLSAFGNVLGTSIATEYISQRSTRSTPGFNGWTAHGITPAQGSQNLQAAAIGLEPFYQGYLSEDLSTGVFRSWSPLTIEPAVGDVPNMYVRRNLLTPGNGNYELATGCPICLAPLPATSRTVKPGFAGASDDFGHVIFESGLNLAAGASGGTGNKKLYEWDHGTVRLVGVLPTGAAATRSVAGKAALLGLLVKSHVPPISSDGSRIVFTVTSTANGFTGPLHMRINGRTTVQINASELAVPLGAAPATYGDASSDLSRVFFTTTEPLTDSAPVNGDVKAYMWERQARSEVQSLTVNATGGTFALRFVGQTTVALPFDATAAAVDGALEALTTVGAGNVTVTGGPGDGAGSRPYAIEFGGDFAGANAPTLTTDATSLTGGAGTAVIAVTQPVRNLTYLNVDQNDRDVQNIVNGIIRASDDGRYLYFAAVGQLVFGAPQLDNGVGIYLWHDGTISYVGKSREFTSDESGLIDGTAVGIALKQARVTPDGRHLLFRAQSGDGLLSAHGGVDRDHANFGQLYVYRADSGEIACVSCNPSGAASTARAFAMEATLAGGTQNSTYENHALSDDGRYVFFSTADSLVPEDVNNRVDAYAYDVAARAPGLLSTGTNPYDSWFLDASANGDDAFFITREQLVGWDRDQGYDLYDARVGGGFPEPVPPAAGCVGDGCQPPPAATPGAPAAGSSSYRGSGNVGDEAGRRSRRARRCRRGKVRKRVRGRSRCVARRARNAKRSKQAANQRRAK